MGATVVQEIQFNDQLGPLRRGGLDLQVSEVPVSEPDHDAAVR
ncbi:hypothetical protein [Kribbella sp. NPDC006257]